MKLDILIAGVGGQGIITMGSIIGEICVKMGLNVRIAETHGMAQRGGAVEVFIRIGDIDAPLIPLASADYVVALEMIESLRALKYLKRCGWLLLSNIYLPPPNIDKVPTKSQITETLSKLPINVLLIDVEKIVNEMKDSRVVNIAMLGALLSFKDVEVFLPIDIAEDVVEKKLGETNKKALVMGYKQAIYESDRKFVNCVDRDS